MPATTDTHFAELYFTPRFGFWRWSESGCGEIEGRWLSPSLIIFREELSQILAELQPQGWPSLTALLLLCAATRDNWPHSRGWLQTALTSSSNSRAQDIIQLLVELHRVYRLPKTLRETTSAKIALARMVFEGSRPMLTPAHAADALRFLQAIVPHRDPTSWPEIATDIAPFVEQTQALKLGLRRVSRSALESRLQTGLDQQLAPAPITVPDDAATFGVRLAQWASDAELFAVARIARQLISILSWPRSVSEPDDISLGGVSDLTNTGPLDRLLLSELAHDDETLAVRIALKEALYIRRESPSHPTARRRAVLVDTSLRLWGQPRVFAAAVALALAAAEDEEPELSVTVDVADLESWKSVDVRTRAGAVELLSCLSPGLHPADSVVSWSMHGIPEDLPCEPVLITTEETLADPQVRLALGKLPADFHVALVAGDGRFELRQHSAHGWRSVRQAALDLDELLNPPAETRPLRLTNRSMTDRLPAILRTDPFPLRLTHQLEPGHLWILGGNHVLTQASGNRLMLWDGPGKAAKQISTKAPAGKMEAVYHHATHFAPNHLGYPLILAVTRGKDWQLLRINISRGEVQHRQLHSTLSPGDQSAKAMIVEECVFLIARRSIEAFSLETGELLSKLRLDPLHDVELVGSRYLKNPDCRWFRLSFDGEIQLTPLKHLNGSELLIDPAGLPLPQGDAPVCLSRLGGKIIGGRTAPPFPKSVLQRMCQRDSLIMLHGTFQSLNGSAYSYPVTAIWNLSEPVWRWQVENASHFEVAVRNVALRKLHVRHNLRHRFATLDCTGNRICLRSTRQWWQLMVRRERLHLVGVAAPAASDGDLTFERHAWPGISIPFHILTLPNGNTIWLDGRGLMHLLPARTDLPEITLVLDEDNVSGWISTGMVFGDPYYLEDGLPTANLTQVWTKHIAPFFGVAP